MQLFTFLASIAVVSAVTMSFESYELADCGGAATTATHESPWCLYDDTNQDASHTAGQDVSWTCDDTRWKHIRHNDWKAGACVATGAATAACVGPPTGAGEDCVLGSSAQSGECFTGTDGKSVRVTCSGGASSGGTVAWGAVGGAIAGGVALLVLLWLIAVPLCGFAPVPLKTCFARFMRATKKKKEWSFTRIEVRCVMRRAMRDAPHHALHAHCMRTARALHAHCMRTCTCAYTCACTCTCTRQHGECTACVCRAPASTSAPCRAPPRTLRSCTASVYVPS